MLSPHEGKAKKQAERQAPFEAGYKQKLDQAEQEMAAGHYEAADQLLAEAQETVQHADQGRELRSRLREAQARASAEEPTFSPAGDPESMPFLRWAPRHPRAPEVRELVRDYKAQRSRQQ